MSEETKKKQAHPAAEQKTAAAQGKRKAAKKPLSPKEKQRRILIVVLAVAAACLCVAAAVTTFFQKPELPAEEDIVDLEGIVIEGNRKQDFYTFLIIGRDTGGGGNTDTILLAAYDIPNQELNVMSIPRDTMVNVSWDVKKINSVYNVNGGGEEGIRGLYKEVSELVGFVPDYSVVVEWEAVGELVNAIGGVWYDVPRDMDYEDPAQDLSIHVKKGYQKLDGEQAMGVVRFREGKNGYATGDLGRIETQQGFLKALIEQCLKIDKMTKVMDYARIFTEQVTTDLTINNIAWFGQKAIFGGLTAENIHFITMPCSSKGVWSRNYKTNLSYVVPNVEELVQVVNERFNPYLHELTDSELDIMYVNADGTIGCTSGNLQDTKANAAHASRPTPSAPAQTTTETPPEKDPEPTEQPTDPPIDDQTPDGDSSQTGGQETGGEQTPEKDPGSAGQEESGSGEGGDEPDAPEVNEEETAQQPQNGTPEEEQETTAGAEDAAA